MQLPRTPGCHHDLLVKVIWSNSDWCNKIQKCYIIKTQNDVICIWMEPELHAPSPPTVAHKLLVIWNNSDWCDKIQKCHIIKLKESLNVHQTLSLKCRGCMGSGNETTDPCWSVILCMFLHLIHSFGELGTGTRDGNETTLSTTKEGESYSRSKRSPPLNERQLPLKKKKRRKK